MDRPRTISNHEARWKILEQINVGASQKAQTLFEVRRALVSGDRLTPAEIALRWGVTLRTAERYVDDLARIEPAVRAMRHGTGFAYYWEPCDSGEQAGAT